MPVNPMAEDADPAILVSCKSLYQLRKTIEGNGWKELIVTNHVNGLPYLYPIRGVVAWVKENRILVCHLIRNRDGEAYHPASITLIEPERAVAVNLHGD